MKLVAVAISVFRRAKDGFEWDTELHCKLYDRKALESQLQIANINK
jgi:hypothetical protein